MHRYNNNDRKVNESVKMFTVNLAGETYIYSPALKVINFLSNVLMYINSNLVNLTYFLQSIY